MATAPEPEEIYERAKAEGRRRMQMPPLGEATTGFIAGVTVMFGIIALGFVYAYLEPHFGPEVAKLGGAFAFGVGLVFLIVGRSELFSENFFDPVAAAIDEGGTSVWGRLARLWLLTLVLNLVGVVLALGPFDHVVVSVLHLLMGVWLGGVAAGALVHNLAVATAGNLLGGLLLMTFTHTAQARSAERS